MKVIHIKGVPGTGKTTFLLNKLKELKDDGYRMNQILYTTFRREMADDFLNRLGIKYAPYISTIHGISWRLLKSNLGYTDKDLALSYKDYVRFCKNKNIEINLHDLYNDEADEIQQDMTLGGAAYTIYSNCINTLTDFADWTKLPEYMIPEVEDENKITDVIYDWINYLEKNKKIDFPMMLKKVYDEKLTPNVLICMSDESHDMTFIQSEIFKSWCKKAEKVFVADDRNQCVPEGTKILTPKGWKNIEDIKVGDYVISAIGKHKVKALKVLNKHSEIVERRFIEITTKSGKKLKVTDDHLMFVFIPGQWQASDDYWFVYLMNVNDKWRIGITKEPRKRLALEVGDSMIIIKRCKSEHEARFYESYYAYKYGIPQTVFKAEGRKRILPQKYVDMLFEKLNTKERAEKLAKDLGIDLRYSHIIMPTCSVKEKPRVIINIQLCCNYREAYDDIYNQLRVEIVNEKIAKILEDSGFKLRSTGKSKIFRTQSRHLRPLLEIAYKIKEILSPFANVIIRQFAMLGSINPSCGRVQEVLVVPACNVIEGFYVPVYENGVIKYEKVVSVKETFEKLKVYDLEVEIAHNYIANGIVIHNCIYSFWGAYPEFCEEIEEKADENIILSPSHRISQECYDLARKILEFSGQKSPEVKCIGQTKIYYLDNFDQVFDIIRLYDNVAILARTRYHLKLVAEKLCEYGIIFKGLYGWKDEMLIVYSAIWKIRNDKKVTLDELLYILNYFDSKVFIANPKRLELLIKRIKKQEFTKDEVLKMFNSTYRIVIEKGKDPFDYTKFNFFDKQKMNYAIKFNTKPHVKVEMHTLHGSKGLEWDSVILLDGITKRIARNILNYDEEFQNEFRVWYVGLTRARKRLFIVPFQTPFFILPVIEKVNKGDE